MGGVVPQSRWIEREDLARPEFLAEQLEVHILDDIGVLGADGASQSSLGSKRFGG